MLRRLINNDISLVGKIVDKFWSSMFGRRFLRYVIVEHHGEKITAVLIVASEHFDKENIGSICSLDPDSEKAELVDTDLAWRQNAAELEETAKKYPQIKKVIN